MKSLTYVELDVPEFTDTSSPIATETYRFAKPTDDLPGDIDAIPSIAGLSYSPARISLGENLGQRAVLEIAFTDHRHIFDGEAFDSGTFWGKWRARYGSRLIGNDLRWIQGELGQALGDMTTRHFIVEKAEGPGLDGTYKITAKDILKLADDDRAQAPAVSNGFLASAITATESTATLSPSGIGDQEYPASGFAAIGGEEIVSFTRSGDTLTLGTGSPPSGRSELGTDATDHDAGARVQLVLRYSGEDPADIIEDLLTTYANVPASYIDLSAWKSETESFLQRQYTANIAEPTSVNKLVSELAEQAALAIWWDPEERLLRLQVLREISTAAATFTADNTLAEPRLKITEQPRRRISRVLTYFGQRNPLEPLDEPSNFASVEVTVDSDAEADYGQPAVKKIFSRWIPFGGRLVAQRVNDILLARYKEPPRRFSFAVMRGGEIAPALGSGYQIEAWPLQTVTGAAAAAPIQVTRVNPGAAKIAVEADEMLFDAEPVDLVNRVIIIDADINSVNLRTLHDQIYPAPTGAESPAINVSCIIESSATVGAESEAEPAFDVGSWPAGIDLELIVRGRIQGHGGPGGKGGTRATRTPGAPGSRGGTALKTATAISLVLNQGNGEIWSGGGGGGGGQTKGDPSRDGGGGGGGGGVLGGPGGPPGDNGGQPGAPGTAEAGGIGGVGEGTNTDGGDGGAPGLDGEQGEGGDSGAGGAKGDAIDGLSFVTKTGTGDIRGAEVG